MRLPDNIQRRYFVVEAKDKVKTDGMSVLVTIRGINRIKQMVQCVNWALNQTLSPLEVIIIEDGPEPVVDMKVFAKYPEVKYHFIQNKDAFCKSACYNLGASAAVYTNLCGIDADLLMPADFLMTGYMHLLKYDVVFPADDIYYLETEMEDMFDFNFSGKTWQTHRAKWQFHGGSFFIKRQKYFDIGGHDEAFKGHGSEDSEFYKRCHDLLVHTVDTHALLHIEHGYELADFENIERNKKWLYDVQSQKLSDRIRYLKKHNKWLALNLLNNNTTVIPDTVPADFDARIRRLQEIQEERKHKNRKLIDGRPNPKDAAPIIKNEMDIRRRRVLGF